MPPSAPPGMSAAPGMGMATGMMGMQMAMFNNSQIQMNMMKNSMLAPQMLAMQQAMQGSMGGMGGMNAAMGMGMGAAGAAGGGKGKYNMVAPPANLMKEHNQLMDENQVDGSGMHLVGDAPQQNRHGPPAPFPPPSSPPLLPSLLLCSLSLVRSLVGAESGCVPEEERERQGKSVRGPKQRLDWCAADSESGRAEWAAALTCRCAIRGRNRSRLLPAGRTVAGGRRRAAALR